MGMHQMLGPSGGGASDYVIERSLRFNQADSAYLDRTPSSASNRRTWTWSGWHKRAEDSGTNFLFVAGATDAHAIYMNGITGSATLVVSRYISGFTYYLETTQVFRDPAAWYHIVVAYDSTQATTSNRIKVYVNGTQITSFSTANYPSQNAEFEINNNVNHRIGRYMDGYLAEVHFIDGQAYSPSYFAEYDDDNNWIPKRFSGTYGTNGFFLKFKDATNTTTIAEDSSGNNNNFTANNISVTAGVNNDSLFDSPSNGSQSDSGAGGQVTGNYCVLNTLTATGGNTGTSSATLSQGNMKSTNPGSNSWNVETGTIAVRSGKWYYEYVVSGNVSNFLGGWADPGEVNYNDAVGNTTRSYGYYSTGNVRNGNSNTSFGSSYTAGDIIGCAIDIDNRKIYWSKNGSWQNNANPAAGTGSIYTIADPVAQNFDYTIAVSTYDANQSVDINTGQRAFSYTAPSGFKALCTTNLSTPSIAEGSQYFDAKLWTGNSSNGRTIDGYNFSPDFVWIKRRNANYGHPVMDTVRGLNNGHAGVLYTNATNAEDTGSTSTITSFNSDGFNLGTDGGVNYNGSTYVGWAWDAGSSTSTNYDGSINSQVRVNQSAGFSIIAYTGNGSSSGSTVGHGLGAVPDLLLIKSRGTGYSWIVWHRSFTAKQLLYLNHNYAIQNNKDDHFNNTLPTNQVFSLRESPAVNSNGTNFICYAFSMIPGYSATGTYAGSGSDTLGPFIYLGFRPAFVMVKSYTHSENWVIYDSTRGPTNTLNNVLRPNTDNQETATDERKIDFVSNGFKLRGTDGNVNASSKSYFYVAFAEHPFKTARAR
jgi:hypothetical protein